MLFNSFQFAFSLPLVFVCYWLLRSNLRLQNLFVVAVSYLFYGWWDWRFLILIAITSGASFAGGLLIERTQQNPPPLRKLDVARLITAVNIVLNLLILCLFKYFNFFGENLSRLLHLFGLGADWVTVDILLPVGISFYTFQALSYTIDVYRKKIAPTRDAVCFFAYVSFFPQLVAGPIERATNLLPQFNRVRTFDYARAVDGTRQILWGFFKKIVVADNCAVIANAVFDDYADASGATLIVGALMFTFQIYGDFSGYSDIAIGTARLFGIDLMKNFNYPYFSRDIAEFWRRWHISLTTWFRDYVYIPLGGSRGTRLQTLRNTLIIFLLSGFWHGADWTFVCWGAYHALLFIPLILAGKNRKYTDIVAAQRMLPSLREAIQMIMTFALVVFGWIIFRADDILTAVNYIGGIFTRSAWSLPVFGNNVLNLLSAAIGIPVMLGIEWINRRKDFGLDFRNSSLATPLRRTVYLFIALAIVYLGGSGQTFIYFQF